jgi:hypothetical protein
VNLKPQRSGLKKLARISGELGLEGFQIVAKNYCGLENVTYGFMI